MGQAKSRGTLEQRQAMAEQREMELARKRKEHIAKLEKLEKESEQMSEGITKMTIESFLQQQDKYSLTVRQRPATLVPS